MSDLQERLAALSPEKRALFEKMLQQRGLVENVFPLSVMQQGIWFLEQLKPGNPAYIIPAAVRIRGELDTAVLQDAVNEIVRRHEVLRTTFQVRDGKPAQVVRPQLTIDLPEVDLSADPPDDRDLERVIVDALRDPFDIGTGPLLRLRLLRLDSKEYVLAVAMHHLISDGWSVGVLLAELSALYAALAAGVPSPLPDLSIQYGDFATWQQQELRKENLGDDLAYWRAHLAGAPAAIDLPTDRPRPAVQGFNGGSLPFELPASVLDALGALGKRHGATTYMALLAAFGVLLHRYSNQDDIVVGVPMANRGRAEVEPLIGFFVNTLPVRTDMSGDPTFADVLARVRDACVGAYTHEQVPLERIVEELKPARDLSRPPIFQVSLSYQSDPLPTLSLAGLDFERLALRAQGARFDLELQFFNNSEGLSGWFEYDRDLFDESTMARMAGHFRRLIDLVIAAPDVPVDELALMGDDERRQVLAWAAGAERDWPVGFVPERVRDAARRSPDAVAVRFGDTDLSYAELDAATNRLARRLRSAGVGRDVPVGVCMHRSVDLVVSLVAVLKAGGAFMPLDPGLPMARLDMMVTDARPPVVLAQRSVVGDASFPDVDIWCVDELDLSAESGDDLGVAVSGEDLDVEVSGDDLAYVIYTSGSTGLPKGALNTHAGLRNRLLWMQDAYQLDASDRVLQKTPFSFDVSVWEFFWPLITGATLVVARPDGHKDARYLVDLIRDERVTTVHFVPSMLEVFLREPGVEDCADLRRVICSGEALSREHQDRFFARSGAELHNLYGPTEAAIDVTAWPCERGAASGVVPIGFPVANTRVYVLDRFLRPVPVGVPGELYLGGVQVARGYLNRPELTAQRFVEDPFTGGGRLYRTGDVGRLRPDGAVEFLGRVDHQVKLRGFRVELGEIESVLAGCAGVRAAVVLARQVAGDTRLVAYVAGDQVPPVGDLLAFARQRLPEYMVPSILVPLPDIPLTPNGKVDRAALPEPELHRPDLRSPYVAPRDELERSIADIWRELLGIEQVGVDDNFFELGGHSLLMSEVRVRIAGTLERDVSLVELFQYPTVGSLATHLNRPAATGELIAGAVDRAENRRQLMSRRQDAVARRTRTRNGR